VYISVPVPKAIAIAAREYYHIPPSKAFRSSLGSLWLLRLPTMVPYCDGVADWYQYGLDEDGYPPPCPASPLALPRSVQSFLDMIELDFDRSSSPNR
jgi:hypothetical protein